MHATIAGCSSLCLLIAILIKINRNKLRVRIACAFVNVSSVYINFTIKNSKILPSKILASIVI